MAYPASARKFRAEVHRRSLIERLGTGPRPARGSRWSTRQQSRKPRPSRGESSASSQAGCCFAVVPPSVFGASRSVDFEKRLVLSWYIRLTKRRGRSANSAGMGSERLDAEGRTL